MTDLLSHPLIQKYFGCPYTSPHEHDPGCEKWNALRILMAMEEPIKKGERYLQYQANWDFDEEDDATFSGFHPYAFKLPPRFQPPAESERCCACCPNGNPTRCNKGVRCPIHAPKKGLDDLPQETACKGQHGIMCSCMENAIKPPKDAVEEKTCFHKKKCECKQCCKFCQSNTEEVEESIRRIIFQVGEHGNVALEGQLRQLLVLARSSKENR